MINAITQWISDNRLFVAICAVFMGTIVILPHDHPANDTRPELQLSIRSKKKLRRKAASRAKNGECK